jgi:hypothetical protein
MPPGLLLFFGSLDEQPVVKWPDGLSFPFLALPRCAIGTPF